MARPCRNGRSLSGAGPIGRRGLIGLGIGGAALAGAAMPALAAARAAARFADVAPLVPINVSSDRLLRVSVCLRPFRAAGPRIEVEQVGQARVVHHYGHGGSGWSLSWGSALEAVPLALATGDLEVAVIGAGAIGLTSAIVAQRMGARVTIYTKDRFPDIASGNATGTWSPDSRLAMRDAAGPGFAVRWEHMARASYLHHQRFLGLAGDPVEWTDRYELFDIPPPVPERDVGLVGYRDRLRDITPRAQMIERGAHPFRAPFVQRAPSLTFNITALIHQLEADFLSAGGTFVPRAFHSPREFGELPQKTVLNCTGYGARALCDDDSVEPMRGQIAWLLPQAGATYGVHYRHMYLLARRDGIILFRHGDDDLFGYRDDNEKADPALTSLAISEAAAIFEQGTRTPAAKS